MIPNGTRVTIRHINSGERFNAEVMGFVRNINGLSNDGIPEVRGEMYNLRPVTTVAEVNGVRFIGVFINTAGNRWVQSSRTIQERVLRNNTLFGTAASSSFQIMNDLYAREREAYGVNSLPHVIRVLAPHLAADETFTLQPLDAYVLHPNMREVVRDTIVTREMYQPSFDRNAYYTFTIHGIRDYTITPYVKVWADGTIRITFADQNGDEWVNTYTQSFRTSPTLMDDTAGTRWQKVPLRKPSTTAMPRAGVQIPDGFNLYPSRGRRKLANKKYKDKPFIEIKDPKNYESKKFIA